MMNHMTPQVGLYHRVMETNEDIPKNYVFEEIVKRFGNPATYRNPPAMMHGMHGMPG
jgi:hypothetical protein